VRRYLSDPVFNQKKHDHEQTTYVCTFRIYPNTYFSEVKKAACDFWGEIEQKMQLTDEYFNNLVTYEEPIMHFFRTYTTVNQQCEAIVYLIPSSQRLRELHKLQAESIEMEDKKKQGKNGQGE